MAHRAGEEADLIGALDQLLVDCQLPWLAAVFALGSCKLVFVRHESVGDLQQKKLAFSWRRLFPRREGLGGGHEGGIHISRIRLGRSGVCAARDGVDDRRRRGRSTADLVAVHVIVQREHR